MKKLSPKRRSYLSVLCVVVLMCLSGCATYHQRNIKFHQEIARGNFDGAITYLEKNAGDSKGRNRLLYHMELGTALHLSGRYSESNEAFEKAYIILEEFGKNVAMEAVSFLTNPAVVPYAGEDFEKVQIHYYKALNFALMGNYNDALVECRRINVKLNILNDRYETGKKNHYKSDAFAWNFMGILYDSVKEYNNAFICYRNALEAYHDQYAADYGIYVPLQLKIDILNSAWRTGLREELDFYRNQFSITWQPPGNRSSSGTDLVVLWNNGLGPYKSEESINFYLDRGDVGFVNFVNNDRNFFFPVPLGGTDTNSLKDLSFIRMALPQFQTRVPYYCSASIRTENGDAIPLEIAQDINSIALLNLQDRMGRELGKALLRLAIKQAIEHAVRKEDEALGLMVSIINAATERADTRNWQTLPFSIHYARVHLPAGTSQLTLERHSQFGSTPAENIRLDLQPGRTQFIAINDPYSVTIN